MEWTKAMDRCMLNLLARRYRFREIAERMGLDVWECIMRSYYLNSTKEGMKRKKALTQPEE